MSAPDKFLNRFRWVSGDGLLPPDLRGVAGHAGKRREAILLSVPLLSSPEVGPTGKNL